MKWDAGALSVHRNNSPIFRYLSNTPPRSYQWPKKWQEELGIFLSTPGVSWRWVMLNFNMTHQRLSGVFNQTKHLHHLGWENACSATIDDAMMYMNNRPHMGNIPFWVVPFIMDDLKKGMRQVDVKKKWVIGNETIQSFLQGRRNDVFHIGGKPRRWKNLEGQS